MKRFSPSPEFTLGVEEEYQLCDGETGELVPLADRILERVGSGELRDRLCYELFQCVLETNTSICRTVEEVVAELSLRRMQEPREGRPSKPDDLTFILYRPSQ